MKIVKHVYFKIQGFSFIKEGPVKYEWSDTKIKAHLAKVFKVQAENIEILEIFDPYTSVK